MTRVSIDGNEIIDDESFTGTTAYSLPSVTADFSCKSENPPTNPDVVVDIQTDDEWVRIPIVGIEQWINRDGPAAVNRTSKVRFPLEWGSESIVSIVSGFFGQDDTDTNPSYQIARVFFYDELADTWVQTQLGYVGGIGPSDRGIGKFWIYDPSDLLKGQYISQTWGEASLSETLQFAIDGTDARGEDVGIQGDIFDVPVNLQLLGVGPDATLLEDVLEIESIREVEFAGPTGIVYAIRDIAKWLGELRRDSDFLFASQKRFQSNRHTMVDHLDWVCDQIDARWWFEPDANGLILVIDAGGESHQHQRQTFVDDVDIDGTNVNILNNSALIDLKPFNTLKLAGESSEYHERYSGDNIVTVGDDENSTDFLEAGSFGTSTEVYPYVEVVYQPLLERANGRTFTTERIDSPAKSLDALEAEGVKKLREHIAGDTEGSMELEGAPKLNPEDYLFARPVCDDTFTNVNMEPIQWEVNGIKHIRESGDRYTTEIGTSVAFNDEQVTVKTKEFIEA